jgi:hypothetical protein
METAKLVIEVSAGLIPGQAEPEFTRRWAITSAEWEVAQAEDEKADEAHRFYAYLLLSGRAAQADEYARALRNPARFNYVRTDWIWM